ncbi:MULTISPECIES: carotenoid oxygenase family protein [unclassified Kribbella]|uniref:carotenoid oxygenase family protein n=1 Tax=unclassified Kribbella TaxID=2644121 RepID=UPI0033F172C2
MSGRDAMGGADAPPHTPYAIGFADLDNEVTIDQLPVEGDLPEWLSGTLVRNGPARYAAGNGRSLRHWFDGQAMLHRFEIAGGAVSYANRFVDTPNYRSLRDKGRIGYTEFATDPCGNLFSRFFTRFFGGPGVNPAVNIVDFDESAAAVTETPLAVEFDPATLATLRVTDQRDGLTGAVTTAHPHADPTTGSLVNYLLKFGRRSSYQVYRQDADQRGRRLIGSVPVEQPGYVHSFAITQRYVVLVIFPLVVNPLSLLLSGRPFIENYRWRPELGTRIVVIDTTDGSTRGSYQTEACFAFHHINAWDDGDAVVFDLCSYPDAGVVDALYLDSLRGNRGVPLAVPTRFRVELASGTVTREALADEPMELPNIAYARCNGRPYRFAYGVGARDRSGHNFIDQLVKLDTTTGTTESWHQDGCYPGEPVFVAMPTDAAEDSAAEDAGVVLSVVLDTNSGRSFLLILAAGTFAELGRAHVPHAIPFGFHGRYTRTSKP